MRRKLTYEDSQKATAAMDLWDTIVFHSYTYTDASIKNAKNVFTKYNAKFSILVTQMLGLEDIEGCVSNRDTEVGDLVIRFRQLVNAYDGSIAKNNKLVEFSWAAMRTNDNLARRLRQLLQSAFGTGLFNCIRQLGHPLRTIFTIVRAVGSPGTYEDVKVHFGIPHKPHGKTITHKMSRREQHPYQVPSQDVATLSNAIGTPFGETCALTNSSPAGEDHDVDMASASPIFVQAVGVLVESVLRYKSVPVGSHAYYHFGFVTCRSKFDEDALCGYYRHFLGANQNPIVLVKMVKALQLGTLSGLLHNKGEQSLKNSYPSLHSFLTTKLKERPSVYRLIQFIRDEGNDNAAPVLKRDYGFRWCKQQHHVTFLKSVYEMILAQAEPMRLHDACRFGRLRELAIEVLGSTNSEINRLLVNDYPYSTSRLDNNEGLERYLEPQFKPSKK